MDLRSLFSTIGLTADHAALYRALLGKPLTLAEAARSAKLHRPAAYRHMAALEERGLVKQALRGKRTYFMVESPAKLEWELENARHTSAVLLHELTERFEKQRRAPAVTVGQGRKGIVSVYEDILHTLKRGAVFYRYTSASKKRPRNAYVPERYEARRDAKQLERYVITNKRTSALKTQKLERYIRIIPPEFDRFEYDITLLVYGPKIAYIDYASETAITIENPALAQFQKRLFQLLFSKL
jgi:DNA-binding transcriptional ArsR family regulator